MSKIWVEVERIEGAEDLPLPNYETVSASGMDLRAALEAPLVLEPGSTALVPTGLKVAVPEGYELQVRPRSGLALRHGIAVLNSPGTIDADYRGPIQVILTNFGALPFTIQRGDRIAQLVLAAVARVAWKPVDQVSHSERGEGGFGHTGQN